MCLIFLALNRHPRWPLILAGNRDEFHARPTRPLQAWPEQPGVYGGKDLQAGGSWLMAHDSGRWSALTNIRNPDAPPAPASRGQLVLDALAGRAPADDAAVGGYNLLWGSITPDGRARAHYQTNGGGITEARAMALGSGIYGVSNAQLDTPWPKVAGGREELTRLLAQETDDPALRAGLWQLLSQRQTAPDSALPATGVPLDWERRLSARFIVGDDYGTRASTLLLLDQKGRGQLWERQFDARGEMQNEVCVSLGLS